MSSSPAVIRIAAALISDADGRVLLVRKRGTQAFMQAGGKIEPHETPREALARELTEELGGAWDPSSLGYLGRFSAIAANERHHVVEAEVFRAEAAFAIAPAAEIEEIVWVDPFDAAHLPLAPLTRDHILPLARAGR